MDLNERKHKEALRALTSLEAGGFQARLAGGCVRDRLLGNSPKDYDVATSAKPDQVMQHFAATGQRTVPTGLDHGTVTLIMPAGPIEITTLRTDVATDGRHAQVAFGESFEQDAARRDFTINAMFEDARGVVYDYYSGQVDLKAKILRFVGDPGERIREDFLRIMRFFRFTARFGFASPLATAAAITQEREGLLGVSQERITAELIQLLEGFHAATALKLMVETAIFPLVLPEISSPHPVLPEPADVASWARFGAERRGLGALASLLSKAHVRDGAKARAIGERLKLSAAQQRLVVFAVEAPAKLLALGPEAADSLAFMDACEVAAGPGAFPILFHPLLEVQPALKAHLARIERDEARAGHKRLAALPVDGHVVRAELGLKDGPELGRALEDLKRSYRNGEWTTREQGLGWIKRRWTPGP